MILYWCLFQFFKGPAELVRAGRPLRTAADTVETLDDVIDFLSSHQLADSLKVAVTSTQEEHLLNHIVLIGSDVDHLRASAPRFILYMLCLHTLKVFIYSNLSAKIMLF